MVLSPSPAIKKIVTFLMEYVMDKSVRINTHFRPKVTKYFSISNRIGNRINN